MSENLETEKEAEKVDGKLRLGVVIGSFRLSICLYDKRNRWKVWGYLSPMEYDCMHYAGFAFGFFVIGWEY